MTDTVPKSQPNSRAVYLAAVAIPFIVAIGALIVTYFLTTSFIANLKQSEVTAHRVQQRLDRLFEETRIIRPGIAGTEAIQDLGDKYIELIQILDRSKLKSGDLFRTATDTVEAANLSGDDPDRRNIVTLTRELREVSEKLAAAREYENVLKRKIEELLAGREEPLAKPASCLEIEAQKLTRCDYYFAFNSSELSHGEFIDLGRLAKYLKSNGRSGKIVSVVGSADGVGSDIANARISTQRAEFVAEQLELVLDVSLKNIVRGIGFDHGNDGERRRDPRRRRVTVSIAPSQ